jgi:hypothetical protein
MALVHSGVQVRGLATGAFVGQVEVHIDLIFAPQRHSVLGDCSELQFRRYRQQHIELQYHHQLVRRAPGSEFLAAAESLELLWW